MKRGRLPTSSSCMRLKISQCLFYVILLSFDLSSLQQQQDDNLQTNPKRTSHSVVNDIYGKFEELKTIGKGIIWSKIRNDDGEEEQQQQQQQQQQQINKRNSEKQGSPPPAVSSSSKNGIKSSRRTKKGLKREPTDKNRSNKKNDSGTTTATATVHPIRNLEQTKKSSFTTRKLKATVSKGSKVRKRSKTYSTIPVVDRTTGTTTDYVVVSMPKTTKSKKQSQSQLSGEGVGEAVGGDDYYLPGGNGAGGGVSFCPNPTSTVLPCAPNTLADVCNKYGLSGSFSACYEACKPSFCCIHDSRSRRFSPSCSREANCAHYGPCYIVWWKLHDTVGPANYIDVSQDDAFFDMDFTALEEDLMRDEEFRQQLFGHHFDGDDNPLDDTFSDPDNWG